MGTSLMFISQNCFWKFCFGFAAVFEVYLYGYQNVLGNGSIVKIDAHATEAMRCFGEGEPGPGLALLVMFGHFSALLKSLYKNILFNFL